MLVVGENGAGKTNLLEALHVGTQGFSPRTRSDGQLIRFGESGARLTLSIARDRVAHEVTVRLSSGGGEDRGARRGAPASHGAACGASFRRSSSRPTAWPSSRAARPRDAPTSTVCTPVCTRREAVSRRSTPRRSPSATPRCGGCSSASRRLRRCRRGRRASPASPPTSPRRAQRPLAALAPGFDELAGELGLPGGRLDYTPTPPTAAASRAASRRGPRARLNRARAAPRRHPHPLRRPRPA